MSSLNNRYYFPLLLKYLEKTFPREDSLSNEEYVSQSSKENQGSKIHLFKRTDLQTLPRVKEIIGIIKGLYLESIVDFGSQRGALLFPLIDKFPEADIVGVDLDSEVYEMLSKLNSNHFNMIQADITKPIEGLKSKSVDLVIISEVLEHLEEPLLALQEAARITSQYLIVTVPSKPDDNPEHIQFFEVDDMVTLIKKSGFKKINVHRNRMYNLYVAS